MRTVKEICEYLEMLAPAQIKMDWDNVGLLCGHRNSSVETVLVALDPFLPVCEEAAACGAQLLVTHHPLIFKPAFAVNDDTPAGKEILYLAEHGIAAFNAHTNLDIAPDGVNRCLADMLELRNIEIPEPAGSLYGVCYGLLRTGIVTSPVSAVAYAEYVKEKLHCPGVRLADAEKTVRKVAVGGGACGSELLTAVSAGCDTFVTADVKYNCFQDAFDYGINLIDAGHFETEWPAVMMLQHRLKDHFPELNVILSEKNRDRVRFI